MDDILLLGGICFLLLIGILVVGMILSYFRFLSLTEKMAQLEKQQFLAQQGLGSLTKEITQSEANLSSKVYEAEQHSLNSLYQMSTHLTGEVTKTQQDSSIAFTEIKAMTHGLSESTTTLKQELAKTQERLTEVQLYLQNQSKLEQKTSESIRRLESIIAGTYTKGVAGENILDSIFSTLPAEWQVRNFQVAGRTVEFGLRLPNTLILPIDSKWVATSILEQYLATENTEEKHYLKAEIEEIVRKKAKEVRKYLDPGMTMPFGLAVVPDAIYELCSRIHAETFQMNVVLVSYSLFLPYLLLVFQTILNTSQTIDFQQLNTFFYTIEEHLLLAQEELDGRYSKALTMLHNSRDEMKTHLGKIHSNLTRLKINIKD
ncbi:MAG: DNA recombination protein RmuC [Planctomycetota bacterium]